MTRKGSILLAVLMPIASGGCISTAASIVKAPFRVAGQGVDWATTSQEESDRNYGRKMRKREAEEGRQRREAQQACRKHPDDCPAYDGYRAGN